jgi:dihydrofolate reductase
MTVRLIFAQSTNGFIGKDNKLLFQIPEDMKQFKEKTDGSTVIMGRLTWESLPAKFRPLPNRRNIVISSKMADSNPGVEVWTSLKAAIDAARGAGPIWIIGGERLYAEGLLYADEIHETLVTKSFDGDARAPVIDHNLWKRASQSPFKVHNELMYQFNIYLRKDHGNQAQQEVSQEARGRGQTTCLVAVDDFAFGREEVKLGDTRAVGSKIRQENESNAAGYLQGLAQSLRINGQDDEQARGIQGASEAGLEAR